MIPFRPIRLIALLALPVIWILPSVARPYVAVAARTTAVNCAAVTLTLHPGLNPPLPNEHPRIAADIPRGLFTVSLPLYPGAKPLTPFVASPFPEYPADPYLQTASAEYQSPSNVSTTKTMVKHQLISCGWRSAGYWSGNSSIFTSGFTFTLLHNYNLSVELSFGSGPGGPTYLAYGVEEITYLRRPPESYLHGPFASVRITLRQTTAQDGHAGHAIHGTIVNRARIGGLVQAINNIRGYHRVSGICAGGPSQFGPAYLAFVHPNGLVEHAFEIGPGGCGGLAVNGVRWLIDRGAVWNRILHVARGGS